MKKKLILIFATLLVSTLAWGQNRVISGLITDGEGKPVLGATIIASPSGKGTASSADGSFKLQVDKADKEFKVTIIGYDAFIQA
ncbi:MAG: carboxypeptidase-like regulatory domain-containing protein, partial [Mucilaginibacter sp.]